MKHTGIGKKTLSLILAFCMVLSLLPTLSPSASAAWDGSTADYTWYGDGSADTFYIGTAAELKGLSNIVNGLDEKASDEFSEKTIILTSDIDLNSQEWTPIGEDPGQDSGSFWGSFNGNFHTISNLSITTAQTLAGLFGFTYGVIANLKVTGRITVSDNSSCTNGSHGEYVGGLAAICQGTILNCGSNISINVSGTNSSGTYVGELTGQSIAVFNSRADGAITAADSLPADSLYIGGLSGKSFESSYFVNNCSTVSLPASGGAGIGEAVGTDGLVNSDDYDSSVFLTINNFYYKGAHEPCGVHNDNLAMADVFYLSDEILKGGASDSDLRYCTDTSYYEKIPAGETNAVIRALNNGRTAISELPDGYAAKDWASDADGYPTLNFTSAEDNAAPLVYGASTAAVLGGAVSAACNKNGTLYLVPKPASPYSQKSALVSAAAAGGMTMFCTAGAFRSFQTGRLTAGTYQIYAVDKLGQLSSPSSDITLYAGSAWDGKSASYDWYGTGKQSTFYLSTAADLKGFANIVNGDDGKSATELYGKTLILTRDIDLGNHEWTPIGVTYISFRGMFDGQGHTISNLYISSGQNTGLFGSLSATAIKNLNVSGNIAVTLTNRYVDYSQEGSGAGGLASSSCGCRFINCSTDVNMDVTVANIQDNRNTLCAFYIGGLVGCLTAPTNDNGNGIVNCYSRGRVTVTANNDLGYLYVGGLVGGLSKPQNSNYISVCENCYAACPVTISDDSVGKSQNKWIGAVIGGKVDECTADNCFWSTDKTSCSGIGSGVTYEGTNKALVSKGNCSGFSDNVLKGTESTIPYTAKTGSASASNFLDALNGGRSAITCLSDTAKAKKWKYESSVNDGYPVFDDTAPTVVRCSPASNSENISPNPQLTVSFDTPVTGVSGKYLYVVKAEDGAVAGAVDLGGSQVSCSGTTATITLPFLLENSTKYYIAVDDGSFESDAGVSYGGISNSNDWTFTTVAAPLTISSFAPSNGAAGVSISTNPAITFSENVTAVSDKKIYLKKSSDGSTVKAISASDTTYVSISGNTVTITLPDSLENGTGYYITIDNGAFQNAAGSAFAGIDDSAVWRFTTAAANTYSVSGTVECSGSAVSGATVKAVQGNNQFGSTATTAADGTFTIYSVPNGEYDLVVTKDSHIVTQIISVSGADLTLTGVITLPAGYKNSTLVVGSDTPNVVVGYLDEQFDSADDKYANTSGNAIEIKLDVSAKDASSATGVSEISNLTSGKTVDMYLDMALTKHMTGSTPSNSALTETDSLLKIIVPYDLSGKTNVTVYRYHVDNTGKASTQAMTQQSYSLTKPSSECYMLDTTGNQIIIWAQKFSTYAIGYSSNSGSLPSDGGSGVSYYTMTASAGDGGSISPSGSASVAYGGRITYTVTPDSAYSISDVLVDGKSVGAVSSYTFADITQAHTIQAVFAKISGLPYYLNDSGNKVFIGFAADKSGVMKYTAPKGKTVLFASNPKDFTDISGHWAKSYIDFVTQRELFVGTGSSLFSPNQGMTRAMFAAVIGRLCERSYGIAASSSAQAFTDVDYDGYYGEYVDWASQNGIIKGTGKGAFEPDREITREEMAAILYRFAGFLKLSGTPGGIALNYSDASGIDVWAQEAALYCQGAGIITGRENGSFAPKETATRAEVAAILQRFVETAV